VYDRRMRTAPLPLAIASIALLAACEPTVRFDPLSGVTFAVAPMPEACVPAVEPPTSQVVQGTPPPTDAPDPTDPTEPTDPPDEGCDEPLLTRTQGFWKNHPCVIDGVVGGQVLVPISLGAETTFVTSLEVQAYFQTPPKGGNARIILGHQLLAAKFNAKAFGIGDYVFADVDGDGVMETVDELITLGDEAFDSGSERRRLTMGAVLDRLNNAGDAALLSFDPACGGQGAE